MTESPIDFPATFPDASNLPVSRNMVQTRKAGVWESQVDMIEKANSPLVESVRQQSIQRRGKDQNEMLASSIASIFTAADTLPPYWSTSRDLALDDLWHTSDLLSGAMYMMASKMATIPFHVEARDMSVTSHLQDAKRYERRLRESAEWGTGWGQFFQKQVESLLGQDNGRFMEIIDLSPNKSQAIRGPAISVAHLDPSRCIRTSDPKYPVLYRRTDGKLFKLHWTRVAFDSQLPSTKVDLYSIGLCAVSRSASYARRMLDIAKYNEEKIGSRPQRGIVLVGGGLDAEMVGQAMGVASGMTDTKGLERFAWLPIVGSQDLEAPSIELISLSSLPDGFNEQESTEIAMAAIALAFGTDARELWPGMQAASSRADALLAHIKQRGKGPGHILQETARMFNNWFLPRYLKLVFDFQDDAQDRQKAEIRHERASTRKIDIGATVTDARTEREVMVKDGEMSTAQFESIELKDGRLPDGTPIEVLFYRDEPVYTELLTLSGITDPLNLRANSPDTTLDQLDQNISSGFELLATESRQIQKRQVQQSIAALQFLKEQYEELALIEQQEQMRQEELAQSAQSGRTASSSESKPTISPESETPATQQLNDENNMAALENSPRELAGKEQGQNMNIKKALNRVRNRKVDTSEQMILKGLETMMLENMPEAPRPIIQVEPIININMPPAPVQPIIVQVEKQDIPEIIVQSPKIELTPEIIVNPNITVEAPKLSAPAVTKDAKYEVVEILERDAGGDIKKVKRERIDDNQ